ncbi:MAG TPA: hypothetical protein VMZ28_07745 [Kofleriaceae bacterium]|nr:hypothetical protein [Kofleriaceae bacterium]
MKRFLAGGLIASLALAACGGDEEAPAEKGAKKPAEGESGGGGGGGRKKKGKGVPLEVYKQIDESFRRTFTENDFRPDFTGDENRDPFRSYVVRQGTLGREGKSTTTTIQPTDVCTVKNSKASGYSLRDLRLIGIVLRGKIRGFAQFRDGSGLGWTVKRGDCLGKEKAIVQSIDSGSVSLEVVPEAPPNTAPPDPEKRIIPLYPSELAPTVDLPETEVTQ